MARRNAGLMTKGVATATDAMPGNQLVKVKELAGTLSISLSEAYRLLDAGEIASIKIGRARRVLRSSVDDFVRSRLQGGAASS